ncbi:MAG: hypothetical protein UZ22_OP11002000923 [Microgenomates bacterium OLB23]|nr:MAG: hypothetical protein UZ22_OP11002000923 [Microgenomates bacterium OLB23]
MPVYGDDWVPERKIGNVEAFVTLVLVLISIYLWGGMIYDLLLHVIGS